LYAKLAARGVDVVSAAELINYPGQVAGANLVDWNTGKPNFRYRVVKLLADHFGPGDKLVESGADIPVPPDVQAPPPRDYLFVQGFLTSKGERKLLLVNKRNWDVDVALDGAAGATIEWVDQTTGQERTATGLVENNQVTLSGFAVAVVTLASEPGRN
jgi:hypothetical protein